MDVLSLWWTPDERRRAARDRRDVTQIDRGMEIRDRIAKEMARILALPEVRERLVAFGVEPVSSAPAEVEHPAHVQAR